MGAERPDGKALLVLAGAATILLGCVTVTAPESIRTLSVKEFSRTPEAYRGQTLRICAARLVDLGVDKPSWYLSTPAAIGYHPATVEVLACDGGRPIADAETCIVGRIAREDGSLDLLRPAGEIVVKDPGNSAPWYLHAQCSYRN